MLDNLEEILLEQYISSENLKRADRDSCIQFIRNLKDVIDSIGEILENLCVYFYKNRRFYCSALQISGQNSFSEHFVELLQPIIETYIKSIIGAEEGVRFYVDFCIDAYMGALKRWITDKNCMLPEEFLEKLRNCLHIIAVIDQKFSEKK